MRIAIDGLAPSEGVVEYVDLPHGMVIRTGEGIYTFIYGQDMVVVEHHNFSDAVKGEEIAQAWQDWLSLSFS